MSDIAAEDHVRVGKGKQIWKVERFSANRKMDYLATVTDAPEHSRNKYLYRPYATERLTKVGEHRPAAPGEHHLCPDCCCHRHRIY